MQYWRADEWFCVSRVTGPRHNMLRMRLSGGSQAAPTVERLPPAGSCAHAALDEHSLVASVLHGVADANAQLGTSLCVTHIGYVANDTKPEAVYAFLASKLIEHFRTAGELQVD